MPSRWGHRTDAPNLYKNTDNTYAGAVFDQFGGLMVTVIIVVVGVAVLALVASWLLFRSVRIVGEGTVMVVERLGRYHRTLQPGATTLRPILDRVRAIVAVREQVVPFPPQPVFTADNIVLDIDEVISFRIIDPKLAVYAITNYILAIERLTVGSLRALVADQTFEETLRSRRNLNAQLFEVLNEATPSWGIQTTRVAVQSIEPPAALAGTTQALLSEQEPQPLDAPQVVFNVETMVGATNIAGSGGIDAPTAIGERSRAESHRREDSADALRLVQALITEIQKAAGPAAAGMEDKARIIQGELLAADGEHRAPERRRLSGALAAIKELAGTGTAVVAVADQIGKLLGVT